MGRTGWRWLRLAGGVAILAVLVWRVGSGPFVDGVRSVSGWSIVAAIAITAVTTTCSAWRWRVVGRGLGIDLAQRVAVASYYRSQFLNSALPGGVLGDVHRGVRHGRDAGDVALGLRVVVWERVAGQVVQTVVTAAVLLVATSPVRRFMPVVVLGAAVAVAFLIVALRHVRDTGSTVVARVLRRIRVDLREGLLAAEAWPAVVLASLVVVAGYVALFFIAASVAGGPTSFGRLFPLALLVLLSMAVPLSIGGWGPREGVAAWAFAAAGLGADRGVAVATTYGVLSLAATLPGAVVLLVGWWHRRHPHSAARPEKPCRDAMPVDVSRGRAAHG